MRKIKFRGRNLDLLLNFLYDVFGEKANTIKRVNGKIVGFFVWEKYYLRNMRATSCSIFYFQDDQNTCEIEIVGAAGSGGLFDIDWGSKSSIESITAETVIKYAADLELEIIEDIKIKVKEAYRHKHAFPRFPIR